MLIEKKSRILAHLTSRKLIPARPYLMGAAIMVGTCFGVVAAFGSVSGKTGAELGQQSIIESLLLTQTQTLDSADEVYVREEKVRSGDSAYTLLSRLGIESAQINESVRNDPRTQSVFRDLVPGKTITAYLDRNGDLRSLVFPLKSQDDQSIELKYSSAGFQVDQKSLRIEKRVAVKSATVTYSLFGATDAAGIPDSIAAQLVEIFGGDVDFHSDLRKGDRISVVYETAAYQGKPLPGGHLLAAEFVNDGRSFQAVWFQGTSGKGAYYTPDGQSLRKAFLRSPLEFSRVTSGFTMARFHPVLKRWRAHKGVDYGAPIGTQVKATGDAIVDFIGIQNGYGKVVILKHQGPYTTLYGHLSAFPAGLRKGSRVSQGETVGYVGKTGLATGPHLHYEFRINGSFQNPLSVALPGSPPLSKEQLARFRSESSSWMARIAATRNFNLAAAD